MFLRTENNVLLLLPQDNDFVLKTITGKDITLPIVISLSAKKATKFDIIPSSAKNLSKNFFQMKVLKHSQGYIINSVTTTARFYNDLILLHLILSFTC